MLRSKSHVPRCRRCLRGAPGNHGSGKGAHHEARNQMNAAMTQQPAAKRTLNAVFTLLAWLSLVVCADAATAQLPDCNCYFIMDCPAETPICEYTVTGIGPLAPDNPDRSCNWMEPKPPGGPGTGCEQPYDGSGGPCDGVCVATPPALVAQQWNHWDGRLADGAGCLPGRPYSYFVKFVVENEPCDLPAHCSLCEAELFIQPGTLAEGTASRVASALSTVCDAAGFTFDVLGRRIHAQVAGQLFDVCVNGVKVAATLSPTGPALVCQDGVAPTTFQIAGDLLVAPGVPGLSFEGFAILVSLILAGSVVVLVHRASVSRS